MSNQRRTIGIIAAVVLALLGTLGLVAYVQGAKDRAVAGEKLVKVYVASNTISAGTPANELAGKVKTEKVPAKVRATDAVESLSAIKGDVASIDVLPGEQLVTSRFVGAGTNLVSAHKTGVPVGFFGSTFSLEPEQSLGGQLRAGDRVAVVGVMSNNARNVSEDASQLLARNVLVTSVQIDGSNGADPQKKEVTEAPTGKFFVTLALNQKDLESVVAAVNNGKIWLAVDPGMGVSR